MAGKKKKKPETPGQRVVTQNRKARHKFSVLDTLECGIQLVGSEVKSLRDGKVSLEEAYGRVRDGEVWLVGCDIPQYTQSNEWNHDPRRPRKLLLHQREIKKFAGQAHEKGLTLVPLKIYFNARGIAKIQMGLCKGRQMHDKREKLKRQSTERDMRRAARQR